MTAPLPILALPPGLYLATLRKHLPAILWPEVARMTVHESIHQLAEVNHGRWIASCPFCPGASMLESDQQVTLCADCGNLATGHQWLRVAWPRDRARLEAVLVERPDPGTRNWHQPESLRDLQQENERMMGDGNEAREARDRAGDLGILLPAAAAFGLHGLAQGGLDLSGLGRETGA